MKIKIGDTYGIALSYIESNTRPYFGDEIEDSPKTPNGFHELCKITENHYDRNRLSRVYWIGIYLTKVPFTVEVNYVKEIDQFYIFEMWNEMKWAGNYFAISKEGFKTL